MPLIDPPPGETIPPSPRTQVISELDARFDKRLTALAARVTELEHDLAALAELAGSLFGEPFRSQAREIVTKRQTGGG